jgi:proline dehydrogenase
MSSHSLLHSMVDSSLTRSILEKKGIKHPLVRRFVAGDQLSDALMVTKALHDKGITAAIDYLGEDLQLADEIEAAVLQYSEVIKGLATFYPDAYVSIKLTAIGLLQSVDLARDNLRRILEYARDRGNIFVRVDMEGSKHTQDTLDLVQELHKEFPGVGAVIQSYLLRSDSDIAALMAQSVSIRLVKGAYNEPESVAYPQKADVDRQFKKQMFHLIESGESFAIATHDEKMIRDAKLFAKRSVVPKDRFEFEMLMGVRGDLQTQLKAEGYRVRVYIPYGEQWYAYFTRRLSERPENLGFLLKNVLRP